MAAACRDAGVLYKVEPRGLGDNQGGADIAILSATRQPRTLLDVTAVNVLAQDYVSGAAQSALFAAKQAEQAKMRKYASVAAKLGPHVSVRGLVFESGGAFGPALSEWLDELATEHRKNIPTETFTGYLWTAPTFQEHWSQRLLAFHCQGRRKFSIIIGPTGAHPQRTCSWSVLIELGFGPAQPNLFCFVNADDANR